MGKPKIRFKGYTEDWEQRKVTDLGEIYIGLVTTMTEHYTDKGHLLIRNSDIKDGYFEFGENPIYLDEEFSEQNKSRMHQLGDVITVHTGDIGTSAVIGENEVNSIGFATIVTRPNQEILDSNYFATYLNTDIHKQWAISMATGDGRSNYNLKDYTKLVVPIPQIGEQKKMAACIGNLNGLITLHQRKCEETKKLKKYMLQKMFPKNGESVPEIRFAGFTDAWEQRKLSELLYLSNEKNDGSYTRDDVLAASLGTELQKKHIYFGLRATDESVKNYKVVLPKDVIYTKSPIKGFPNGIIRTNKGETGIVPTLYCVYHSIDTINPSIIQAYFESKERLDAYLVPLVNIGARNNVNITDKEFINGSICIPKNETEQNRIVDLLEKISNLITLHQRKCDELKNMKQYMLQNMFV